MKTVKIKDIIQSSYASDNEQGDTVFKAIERLLKRNK